MPSGAKRSKPRAEKKLLSALSHPLRWELVRLLTERTASPNEVANHLNAELSTVSYHIRELTKLGFLELVDEEKRRGAVEHFYRGIARAKIDDREWEALPVKAREDISCQVLRGIFGEAYSSLAAGRLDAKPERHISWISLNLDVAGWQELTELLLSTHYEIAEIQARSEGRMVKSGEEGTSYVGAILGFERSPTVWGRTSVRNAELT